MLRTILRLLALAVSAAALGVAWLLVSNPAPATPAVPADVTDRRPYVIKLHARWCPVCMMTKDVWTTVEETYGPKVRLVVFDFTTEATTEKTGVSASHLGLDSIFEAYRGETGTVLVVDGATKSVEHSLHGDLEWSEYAAAIDSVLAKASSP
jgi:hypothetical protein